MDAQRALELIQRMHTEKTVRRESIVGWYRFYARKLPRMHPERSDVDLIRTVALWMQLTDRGGSPGFPYEYKCEVRFPTIDPKGVPRASVTWPLGVAAIIIGIIVLFFNWKIGLALVVAGPMLQYIGYRLRGGPANPDLMKEGTTLYEREGRRVLEWAEQRRPTEGAGA